MKKKSLAMLLSLSLILVLLFTACGESSEEKTGGDDTATNVFEFEPNVFEYLDAALMEDTDEELVLVTTWNFTNNEEEATSSLFLWYYELFQADEKLEDSAVIFINDDYDTLGDFEFKNVEAGETGKIYLCYKLKNLEDPVLVRLTDLFDEVEYEIDIDVASLEIVTVSEMAYPPANASLTDDSEEADDAETDDEAEVDEVEDAYDDDVEVDDADTDDVDMSDAPIIGRFECVKSVMGEIELDPMDEWIEFTDDGRGTLFITQEFPFSWTMTGNEIQIKQDAGIENTATYEDGVIILDTGMLYYFE